MKVKFLRSYIFFSVLALLVRASVAIAEEGVQNEKNTNGFFPAHSTWFKSDDSNTVFAREPEMSESPDIGFYKERDEKKKPIEEPVDAQVVSNTQGAKRPPFDTRKATKEQIVAFFGDPNQEPELTPEEKAPTPFKAMGAALDSGNDELAFKYARQYVRWLAGTEMRVDTVNKLTDLALEREGIRASSIPNNPYKHLLNDDLKAEENGDKAPTNPRDKKLAELLRKAASAEGMDLSALNNAPVDPQGQVDVMLFMESTDPRSLQTALEFEKAYRSIGDVENTIFMAFVSDLENERALAEMGKKLEVSYPIRPGKAVGTNLSVVRFPTIVFLTRNTHQFFRIEDAINAEQIEKTVRHIMGKKDAK